MAPPCFSLQIFFLQNADRDHSQMPVSGTGDNMRSAISGHQGDILALLAAFLLSLSGCGGSAF